MSIRVKAMFILFAGLAVMTFSHVSLGDEPGWTDRILKTGEDRERTNSQPIVERPYRPLHFYGNTVRRLHYRGQARPTVPDLFNTVVYSLPLR